MRILSKTELKTRSLWLGLGAVCLLPVLVMTMRSPTNFAETRHDHSDPQLRTRVYRVAPSLVASTVAEIVPRLRTYGRPWRIVSPTPLTPQNTMQVVDNIRCEVPVLFFTDDLTITIREQNEQTHVDVESRSRVGRGDFGENRRHIIQVLHALDARMNK